MLEPALNTVLFQLGDIKGELGDHDESIRLLQRAVELTARDPTWLGGLGAAYGRAGSDVEVDRVRDEISERETAGYSIIGCAAMVDVNTGHRERAMRHVEQAQDEH